MAESESYVNLFYKGMSLLVPMSFVLNEHPGGAEYILQYANQDITNVFEDMNHSADALTLLRTFEDTSNGSKRASLYDGEQSKRNFENSIEFDEEAKRKEEMRQWRQWNWVVTAATTLAAMGIAAYAMRRHAQHQ